MLHGVLQWGIIITLILKKIEWGGWGRIFCITHIGKKNALKVPMNVNPVICGSWRMIVHQLFYIPHTHKVKVFSCH